MSRIVYLKDGRKCKLVSQTDDGKYIVNPFNVYFDYVGDDPENEEEFELPSDQLVQVDKVYSKPPIDVIDAEYNAILRKVEAKRDELTDIDKQFNRAKFELQQINKQKTDLSRFIINREELKTAKRLIVWPSDKISPRIMGGIDAVKFNISYTIEKWPDKEKVWSYKGYTDQKYNPDSWSSYSEYFDEKIGIKADLTDDEILSITHQRQWDNKFDEHAICSTDEKWLTPENIVLKKGYAEQNRKNVIQKAENDLKIAQEKLNMLRSSMPASY